MPATRARLAADVHALPAEDTPAPGPRDVDFDLHGVVGIRVCEATERDAAVVAAQLGLAPSRLERAPDVFLSFVDRLDLAPLTLVGLDDAGFAGDDFVLLRGRRKTRARVALPLDRVGSGVEIVCERGAGAVPLLVQVVNLVALTKGVLPLHASAFVHEGVGVVVTGWTKGGKTEALLGFVERGAQYVGDEWVYITDRDRRVYGIQEPVRIWDWHLRSAPGYRAALTRRERARLRALRAAHGAVRLLPAGDGFRARADALLQRQRGLDVAPERLFGADAVAPSGGFDVLFLAASHESSAITVEPVDPLEVALRMTFSLQYERRALWDAYRKFRFAFPRSASTVLERSEEAEGRLLRRAFSGKPAFVVRHPYPVDVDALARAMSEHCPAL
jgi:hypothetical protein